MKPDCEALTLLVGASQQQLVPHIMSVMLCVARSEINGD